MFQGDALSPLLFGVVLIPLARILQKTKHGYNLNGVNMNHSLYMDGLKLYARSEKGLESLVHTVRIFSADIGIECNEMYPEACNQKGARSSPRMESRYLMAERLRI